MENSRFDSFLATAEYPFIRQNMSEEEYQIEYDYFVHHNKEYREGTYLPLWKQRELA